MGAGPASLTVARDLLALGYSVTVFDSDRLAGGMIRSQIPRFRLPEGVIDEEVGYILDLGAEFKGGHRVDSLKKLLSGGYDAVFVGSGIFKSEDPAVRAKAIVEATTHFRDAAIVAKVSRNLGDAMRGEEIATLDVKLAERGW